MKALIFALCVLAVSASYIHQVANNAQSTATTWYPENPDESRFKDWTEAEMREFLSLDFTLPNSAEKAKRVYARNVPEHFDAREEWPGCVGYIRDQGNCGSCWAFCAVTALGDRFCIDSGMNNPELSPQVLVSCDSKNHGCKGGSTYYAYQFLKSEGTVSEKCYPYISGKDGEDHECKYYEGKCPASGQTFEKSYDNKVKYIMNDVETTQWEIKNNGPVTSSFYVYEDFPAYKGGIYEPTTTKIVGGHGVKVVGWGEESGIKYWIAQNSWGADWGEHGFFRIKMGTCEFEQLIVFAVPKLSRAFAY
jgi:cathepsin B